MTVSDDGRFQNAEFSLYDQRGHLWEQLWVNGSTAYKVSSTYEGGAFIRRITVKALLNELRHRYDALGRLHELVSYDDHGIVAARVTNDYDDAAGVLDPQPRLLVTHGSGRGSRRTSTIP